MALSPRAVALVLLGLVPVVIWPSGWTVRLWILGCLLVVAVDLLLAASPTGIGLARRPLGQVRVGERSHTEVLVTNGGRRPLRGWIRDAWQPSAGASPDRLALTVPAGERTLLRTELAPKRRGDRLADRVTIRAFGPLGIAARQASVPLGGTLRALHPFPSRRHIPSRLRSYVRVSFGPELATVEEGLRRLDAMIRDA